MAPLKKGTGDVAFFRLKPGIGIDQASSRLTELVAAMNADIDPAWSVRLSNLQDDHVESIRPLLSAVMIAVGMLVLIACSNVAMLQTMRALGREQEMAIRSALGAGRTRVFTQLLVENGLLAIASFLLALLIVHGLVGALLPAVESYVGRLVPGGPAAVVPSVRVLAMMGMIASAGTVVFGAIAGVRLRQDVETLRTHGAGTETQRRARLRHGLAVLQVGAAFALLVGAALAMRTAWHMSRVDLGFDPAGVITSSLVLAPPGYPDDESRRGAATRLLDALQRSPEIKTAGLITVPAFGIRFPRPVFREGESEQGAPTAVLIGVNGGYFDTVRLRLIAGRALSDADSRGADPVAVMSAALAAKLFGSEEAIGRTVTTTALRPMHAGVEVGPAVRTTYRIVGVVADVRRSLRRDAVAEMYVPLAQASLRDLTLQVRGRAGVPAAEVTAAMARSVGAVDRDVPLNDVEPLDALIARQGLRPQFIATLLGLFAALAALGALAGLYAVSAWVAGQRRREAAIRLALGASRAQVIRAFTAAGLASIIAGLLAGWCASLLLGRLMTRELAGVSGEDPTTRALAAIVLFVCCAAAIYRPARAMIQVSPAETLRE
jgi:predicted permease